MTFESLALCEPLLRNLKTVGYQTPTPIQEKAIPPALAGKDVLGCAQTGTGKTGAFVLPTLQRLMATAGAIASPGDPSTRPAKRQIRALVLTPTRELASQIAQNLTAYGKQTGIRHAVIFGGVSQMPQVSSLKSGVDVLVATPGRLLDLMQQGYIRLASIEVLILDEADHMLDIGFIHDLKRIVAKVPAERQTLMFSATMPPAIRELASQWLRKPVEVRVSPVASTPDLVAQEVCFVEKKEKPQVLIQYLNDVQPSRTLVFSRTKHGADKLVRHLEKDGIRAIAIHGNKSQSKRTSAMRAFGAQRPPVLVATDLAARGLDFSHVSHVINFDLPEVAETYVHRIGRTARAGAAGSALSFCDRAERKLLRMIERLTGIEIPVVQLPGAKGETVTKDGEAKPSHRETRSPHREARSPHREARSPKRESRPAQSDRRTPQHSSQHATRPVRSSNRKARLAVVGDEQQATAVAIPSRSGPRRKSRPGLAGTDAAPRRRRARQDRRPKARTWPQ
jgi:ATP-dependent RNA helicase RhlE